MNNEEDYMFDDDFEVADSNLENNEIKVEEKKEMPTTNINPFEMSELPDLQTFPSFDIPDLEPNKNEEIIFAQEPNKNEEIIFAQEPNKNDIEPNYDFDFNKMNEELEQLDSSFDMHNLELNKNEKIISVQEPNKNEIEPNYDFDFRKMNEELEQLNSSLDMHNLELNKNDEIAPIQEPIIKEPELNYDFDFGKNMNEVEHSKHVINENIVNAPDTFNDNLNGEVKLDMNSQMPDTFSENDAESIELQNSDVRNETMGPNEVLNENQNNNDVDPGEIDYASLGAVVDSEPKAQILEFADEQNVGNEEIINNENETNLEQNVEPHMNGFEITDVIEKNNEVIENENESVSIKEVSDESLDFDTDSKQEINDTENIKMKEQLKEENITETSIEEKEESIIKKPSLKLGKLPKIKLNKDQKFMLGLIIFIAVSIFLLPYIRAFFNK